LEEENALSQKKLTLEDLGKIKARVEAGDTIKSIAEEIDVSENAVRYHVRRNSWEKGIRKTEVINRAAEREKQIVVSDKVERSLRETENFIQDSERIRAMTIGFHTRLVKNRDKNTNEIILDKEESDIVFQYLKCCKITMETLSIGYMGKRKAYGMDDELKEDMTVLPWED
jgi:transposase-like protein